MGCPDIMIAACLLVPKVFRFGNVAILPETPAFTLHGPSHRPNGGRFRQGGYVAARYFALDIVGRQPFAAHPFVGMGIPTYKTLTAGSFIPTVLLICRVGRSG